MRHYTYEIDGFLSSTFFGPIRGKSDVLLVQMNSIKHMLIKKPVESREVTVD
jgi:hypothetical protein